MSFPGNEKGVVRGTLPENFFVGTLPAGYDPNVVARPVPGAQRVGPYNAEADKTIPIAGKTIPVSRRFITELDPGKTASIPKGQIEQIDQAAIDEARRQERKVRLMGEYAGALLLSIYDGEVTKLDAERQSSNGSVRQPRFAPNVILQEVTAHKAEVTNWKQRVTSLAGPTITKDPKALLWKIPGLERQVNGIVEQVAVAANLSGDPEAPAGTLMVIKGDITRTRPGEIVEVAKTTEEFDKRFPQDDLQREEYWDAPENNFRNAVVEPWTPTTYEWDNSRVAGNSTFETTEVRNAMQALWDTNRLDNAASHFGYQLPNLRS